MHLNYKPVVDIMLNKETAETEVKVCNTKLSAGNICSYSFLTAIIPSGSL